MQRKYFKQLVKAIRKISLADGDLIVVPQSYSDDEFTQVVNAVKYVCGKEKQVAIISGDITKTNEAELLELAGQKPGLFSAMFLLGLVAKIRAGVSISELQRIVGPSEDDETQSKKRIERIDSIWSQSEKGNWGHNPDYWPSPFGETYKQLQAEQKNYENKYL